jgi:hypothetical protein
MLCAVALAWSELPLELIAEEDLARRVHERGGEREIRFYWFDYVPVLPVWFEGRLRLVRWGNRTRRTRLPLTSCTKRTTIEAGGWAHLHPEPVRILATFGLDMGTWFTVKEGIEGIAVRDERGSPVVYVVCEPATDYYRLMTKSNWMPALLNQVI